MRRTVIPAQITTVEDKIAGNLNLSQILLLMMPVLVVTILFTFVPPTMKLTGLKIMTAIISILIFGILALRIKERVVLNWLLVWLKFRVRPSIYVFDKNDNYLREIEAVVKNTKPIKVVKKEIKEVDKNILTETEAVKLWHLINNRENSFSYGFNQKGGLNVAIERVEK